MVVVSVVIESGSRAPGKQLCRLTSRAFHIYCHPYPKYDWFLLPTIKQVHVHFSPNVASLTPSATLALAARARQLKAEGRSVIDLSAGEPAFPTPSYAARAGIAAIEAGKTGYPPTRGIPSLRRAVIDYLKDTTRHPTLDEGQVMVSAGVKQALHNCIFCLFGPGDEVLIPAPYWPTYPSLVQLAGARPIIVEAPWEDGFLANAELLESYRTENTRGLLLNSPCNPTGSVYSHSQLAEIVSWSGKNGIWLLADEIYRQLHFGEGPAPSVWDVDGRPEHLVLLDGVSKAFCMTGWRIGFAVGPPELIGKATDYQSQTTSGAVTPSQHAAAAALSHSSERETAIRSLLGRLERNRSLGLEMLSEVEALEVLEPRGAIYFYVRLRGRQSGLETAERLLMEGGVAAIPGEPFGSPGHLRFNFAVEQDTLSEGFDRVQAFFRNEATL